MSEPLYELEGVSRLYRRGDSIVRAVDGVDLTIGAGEFVALEGPSGSGKTTLLQLLGTLDRPDEGSILFEGRPLHTLDDRALASLRLNALGFVFQQFNLIPTLTALENVQAALAPRGVRGAALEERAGALLDEVGLGQRVDHLPTHLSGGEQQRVAIARALANEPRVILADEPTGNLDTKTGADVIELLAGLGERHGTTIVVATHDATLAARAPRRVAMRDGAVVEPEMAL
jgi:putative ABC transport system ATP-binding protein